MKLHEIQKCLICDVAAAKNGIHCYRVKIEQMILNKQAIQRQVGLAHILGPDEDIATGMGEHTTLICADCGLSRDEPVALLLERAADGDSDPTG